MRFYERKSANHTGNALLQALPNRELSAVIRGAERVELGLRQMLYNPNETITHVYFPEDGVVSLVSEMKDGSMIEVGTVGNEGMVGVPVFLGAVSSPLRVFSQVPGVALKIKVEDFKRALANGSRLRASLDRYTQALFTQLSQSVACNRLHPVEQRCARWLLTTGDRVGKKRFRLTQEFLAQMVGARRATVNEVLQEFQRCGMIHYSQGQMEITKRGKLEGVTCECYEVVRKEYRKLTAAND
jgi:CRP-like cAMP-binding protein